MLQILQKLVYEKFYVHGNKSEKELLEEVSDLEIPEAVSRGHRLVLVIPTKVRKSVVVRFTTFRHRIEFYTAQRPIGHRAQVRLVLTKPQCDNDILNAESEYIKPIGYSVKFCFCYADVNCQMKIKWADNSEDFF